MLHSFININSDCVSMLTKTMPVSRIREEWGGAVVGRAAPGTRPRPWHQLHRAVRRAHATLATFLVTGGYL